MRDTLQLYRLADDNRIPVLGFPLPDNGSLCVLDDSGSCFIGIDEQILQTDSDLRVHLAHELGHCLTLSFYNRYAARDLRQKHENRADRWAIRELVPEDELNVAVSRGLTAPWELAEYFGVTEPFLRKALEFYDAERRRAALEAPA